MGEEATFAMPGYSFPDDKPVANIFVFCTMMARIVANQRGGKASAYLSECADFVTEVVGKRLSVADPLPAEYDWRPPAAVEFAQAMLEYDA